MRNTFQGKDCDAIAISSARRTAEALRIAESRTHVRMHASYGGFPPGDLADPCMPRVRHSRYRHMQLAFIFLAFLSSDQRNCSIDATGTIGDVY